MILVLVHHRVEAKDGGQIDDLLLRRIGQRLLVLVAEIDCDLLVGRLQLRRLRWWYPLN